MTRYLYLWKILDIYSYIPPRSVFKMNVRSKTGAEIKGAYIETFINPDELDTRYLRGNIKKVPERKCYERLPNSC